MVKKQKMLEAAIRNRKVLLAKQPTDEDKKKTL